VIDEGGPATAASTGKSLNQRAAKQGVAMDEDTGKLVSLPPGSVQVGQEIFSGGGKRSVMQEYKAKLDDVGSGWKNVKGKRVRCEFSSVPDPWQ
jgi:hypothetical protein